MIQVQRAAPPEDALLFGFTPEQLLAPTDAVEVGSSVLI